MSSGSGNNNEITIVIRADGSAAVQGLNPVNAAIDKMKVTADGAKSSVAGTTAVINGLTTGAAQASNTINNVTVNIRNVAQETHNAKVKIDAFSAAYKAHAQQMAAAMMPLSAKMKEAFLDRRVDVQGFIKTFGQFSTELNQGLEVVNKIGGAMGTALDFTRQAAMAAEAKQSFESYTRTVGVSAETMLNKLRVASNGTISDVELVKTASKAMSLGVTKDVDEMANLLLVARNKARLFGMDTSQAFEDIVTGIGRGSPMILDNLGIQIPQALREMEGGIKSAEGVQAILNATLADGMKQIQDMGGVADTAADSYRRAAASVQNLKDAFGEELLPTITNVVDFMRTDLIPTAEALVHMYNSVWQAAGRAYEGTNGKEWAIAPDADKYKDPYDRAKYEKGYYQKVLEFNNSAIGSGKYPQATAETLQNQNRILQGLITKADREMAIFQDRRLKQIKIDQKARQEQEEKQRKEAEEEARKKAKKAADEATRAAKEVEQKRKERFDAYSKATTKSFMTDLEGNQDFIRNGSAVLTNVGKPKALEAVIPVLNEATRAAGLFVNTLSASDAALAKMASSAAADPLKWVRDLADTASAKLLPTLATATDYMQRMSDWSVPSISEKAIESVNAYASGLGAITVGYEAMKGAANKVKPQMRQWQKDDENKAFDEAFEKAKQQAEEFDRRMTLSLADATEAGLADGFTRGGNIAEKFAKGFGDNMLRQISSALSYGLTQALFSGGGGNIIGYLSGQNNLVSTNKGFGITDILNPVNAVQKYLSGNSSSSTSSAGNGLLGTLLKPMAKNGKLLWGNIGSNLLTGAVAGFAVNRLFGSGGLFGGSVVHGQESFDSSADLNTQVGQAKTLRDELLKNTGITEETRRLLDEASFNYTWVRKTKSGNGITSKKTTTYLLEGSAAAQASIDAIKELQKKVEGEQAWRQYEIAQAGQFSDIEPLKMALTDIDRVATRANDRVMSSDELSRLQSQKTDLTHQLQAAQANASQNRWGFLYGSRIQNLQNQISSLESQIKTGSAYKMTEAERADILTQQMQAKSSLSTAIGTARNNAASFIMSNPLAADTIGAQALLRMANGDQALGTNRDMISLMLPGIKQAGLAEFELQKRQLEAGDDPAKLAEVLKSRQSGMSKAIEAYEKMWKDAEAEANDQTLAIEEQAAAFERFQEIQTTLLNAKLQSLQLDQQIEQLEKEKKEKRADDLLSSIFTTVGEIRDQGGKEVLIAFTDTPDGRTRLDEWLSIIEGRDPDTAAVIRKGFEAAQLPRLK
ncbi:MAG TPA: hypothetical protein PLU72_18265 [Candidatus Ozemobacteraceae bacterium]|nr:hypothetical protein [Candidatus Ozemobacteraceae bacterium]HQG27090.1 hypothetical protein [Candidatus Ozemobacteraceae bacterium]